MKNQAKLKNLGLEGEERYYYLRYGQNSHGNATRGTATICLVPIRLSLGEPVFVRGVAFCNPRDQFNRKLGRAIALGRAIKAIENRQSKDPIPMNKPVSWALPTWSFLSIWDASLTKFEQKMFEPRTEMFVEEEEEIKTGE